MILHLSHRFFTDACTFICITPRAPARRPAPPRYVPSDASVARYLCNHTIRPRDRSYGEISTVTESPGMIRMYRMRILPHT